MELRRIKDALEQTGKGNQFAVACAASLLLMIVGCVIAIMIDNPFLVPVFAIAFAMIPFIYAKRTVAYYDNHVKEELETALSIITTSYVRTDDIVSAVKENIQYLKPPVKDIFAGFVAENMMISSDVKQSIRHLKEKVNNSIFAEWCETLIACQDDRTLKDMLPVLILTGGSFATLAYFAYGKDGKAAMAMANRFASVFLAAALGMSVEPADMTRNLSTLKMPRGVTLGMLIATSFPPVLGAEIKRVREAMEIRGAGSVLNPKIFYRAFLVPFVMRLVNISDTLSLSVETRGFSLEKVPYTVYKKEIVCMSDVLFISGLAAGAIVTVVL